MSDSVQPHRWQPIRLLHPRDFPGKSTGVGCHFLLQCMKVKSESEVAQLGPTLRDPMDCSLPGSSIYSHAKEWNWTLAFYQSQKLTCNGWIKGLSIRAETVKLLVGNKKNAHWHWSWQWIFGYATKSTTNKCKKKWVGQHQIKKVLNSKINH